MSAAHGPPTPQGEMGFWAGRVLRRATPPEMAWTAIILALAIATVVSGRHAARAIAPGSTSSIARMLDDLEMPTRLPNAPLTDVDGKTALLRERFTGDDAVVAFYAPWCGPCQKELPHLVDDLGPLATILVVVSADEDQESTRRQIANLGVPVTPLIDTTGALARGAKVTALPTTFLVSRDGAVLLGTRGYSWLAIYRMKRRLAPSTDFDPGGEVE